MQVSAKLDYALRALLELAAHPDERRSRQELAEAQDIPSRYLEEILRQLRQSRIVTATRGPSGGYTLARPPGEVSVADVARAVDGPLTLVQGQRPEAVRHDGVAAGLPELWVGVRAAVRSVLETVSLGDLLSGRLPDRVQELVQSGDAWVSR